MSEHGQGTVRADSVVDGKPLAVDLALSKGALSDLAGEIGAVSVAKFRFKGRLERLADDTLELTATLGATVTQSCVVTLAPVRTRIDEPVRRLFGRVTTPKSSEYHLGENEDVDVDPLGEVVDLLAVAREALILALPLSPRAGDAALSGHQAAPPGKSHLSQDTERPFAARAALKLRRSGDG